MSDRIGDYRDPFWSARDRRIRKAHLDALAAHGRVQESDAKIAQKRREEHAEAREQERRALAEQLGRDMARLVIDLAALSVPTKDRWISRIEQLDLTGASAPGQLAELRQDVEFYRRVHTPQLRAALPELSLNPLMLKFQHEEEDRDARRRAVADELEAVSASLANLIEAVRRYRT